MQKLILLWRNCAKCFFNGFYLQLINFFYIKYHVELHGFFNNHIKQGIRAVKSNSSHCVLIASYMVLHYICLHAQMVLHTIIYHFSLLKDQGNLLILFEHLHHSFVNIGNSCSKNSIGLCKPKKLNFYKKTAGLKSDSFEGVQNWMPKKSQRFKELILQMII